MSFGLNTSLQLKLIEITVFLLPRNLAKMSPDQIHFFIFSLPDLDEWVRLGSQCKDLQFDSYQEVTGSLNSSWTVSLCWRQILVPILMFLFLSEFEEQKLSQWHCTAGSREGVWSSSLSAMPWLINSHHSGGHAGVYGRLMMLAHRVKSTVLPLSTSCLITVLKKKESSTNQRQWCV